MTKSNKHKKLMKKEKKKFKASIKLKKSQNETKTDFKARKIILREQLAEKPDSGLVTKKKLNINELISRLNHHSVFVRQDGVNGLKELITKNSKLDLGPYLSKIFTSINPCLLDSDHLMRKSSIKLIEIILTKIGGMIKPYFDLLSSHLSWAMVHIDAEIQNDSLLLMDALLKHTPALIAANASKILTSFIHLVSRQVDRKGNSNDFSLISNPNSKLASIKWRIKLFQSLSRYLDAILNVKSKHHHSIPVSPWQVITIGCLPSLAKNDADQSTSRTSLSENEAETFVKTMVPLLFQSWAEIEQKSSSEGAVTKGTPLSALAIEILRYISEIILQFWNLLNVVFQKEPLEIKWFRDLLRANMDVSILENFPYSALKGAADKNAVRNCQRLNIGLASLSLNYRGRDKKAMRRTSRCYIDILNCCDKSDADLDYLAPCVSKLLSDKAFVPLNMREQLLEASLSCYKKIESKARYSFLQVPLQASDWVCNDLWRSAALRNWMESVAEEAIRPPRESRLLALMVQWKLRAMPGYDAILDKHKMALRECLNNEMDSSDCEKSDVT